MAVTSSTAQGPSAGTFFPLGYPNRCWVQAHLEGRTSAQVTHFGSGEMPATACLVRFGAMFAFAGGTVTEEVLHGIAAVLGPDHPASIVMPRDVALDGMRLPDGYRVARRCHHRVGAARILAALGAEEEQRLVDAVLAQGYDVRSITPGDAEDPLLQSAIQRVWGSVAGFARHELLGHCATLNGGIVSWLHPVVAGGEGEVGSFTHPDHRGRGLIPALVYRAARQLARRGYDMTASWDPDHAVTPRHGVLVALEHEFDYQVLAPCGS